MAARLCDLAPSMSDTYHPLIAEADFPEDGKFAAKVRGWHVLVCRTDEGFRAINDRCTHAASPLSGGRIRRGAIMCPLHGARYDLADGKCLGGAYAALRTFDLRIVDGQIEVALPDQAPAMDDLPIIIA